MQFTWYFQRKLVQQLTLMWLLAVASWLAFHNILVLEEIALLIFGFFDFGLLKLVKLKRRIWNHLGRNLWRRWCHRELCKWVVLFHAKFVWWVFSVESVSPLCFLLLLLQLGLLSLVGFHFLPFHWEIHYQGIQVMKLSVSWICFFLLYLFFSQRFSLFLFPFSASLVVFSTVFSGNIICNSASHLFLIQFDFLLQKTFFFFHLKLTEVRKSLREEFSR